MKKKCLFKNLNEEEFKLYGINYIGQSYTIQMERGVNKSITQVYGNSILLIKLTPWATSNRKPFDWWVNFQHESSY